MFMRRTINLINSRMYCLISEALLSFLNTKIPSKYIHMYVLFLLDRLIINPDCFFV